MKGKKKVDPRKMAMMVSPVAKLKACLAGDTVQEQFENALAEKMKPFLASLVELYAGDNYLQKCDPSAVISQALIAATLNLPLNKVLGFAYIVPYKLGGKLVPNLIVSYKGMIQLAQRTGKYRYINADVVFEGEYCGFDKLTGKLNITGEATSEVVVGYFAHIETTNGFVKSMYMSKPNMEKHGKKYSASFANPKTPWQQQFDAMGIKTMIRKLLGRFGIMSVEMAEQNDREANVETRFLEAENSELIDVIDIDQDTGEILDIGDDKTPSVVEDKQPITKEEFHGASASDPGF